MLGMSQAMKHRKPQILIALLAMFFLFTSPSVLQDSVVHAESQGLAIRVKDGYPDTLPSDGRSQTVLIVHIDETNPTSSIQVNLPRGGTYEYSVQARMVLPGTPDFLNLPFRVQSNGRGTIEVEPGKEFKLTTHNILIGPTGNTWYAKLSDRALEP